MNFEAALTELKSGGKVIRTGWSGAEKYIKIVNDSVYEGQTLNPYLVINVEGESCDNVIGYDIDKDGLNNLLVKYPHHFYYVVGSVSDPKSINKAIKDTISQYKKIDILLNTAGVLDDFKNTLDTDEALWDKVM